MDIFAFGIELFRYRMKRPEMVLKYRDIFLPLSHYIINKKQNTGTTRLSTNESFRRMR